jgi:hypothetical protein
VSPISKASLVNSAREEVGEKASNMNASTRTRFVIVEAMMLTNPPFLEERNEVRRAARSLSTTCLLLGFLWDTEVIMLYTYAYKNLNSAIEKRIEGPCDEDLNADCKEVNIVFSKNDSGGI